MNRSTAALLVLLLYGCAMLAIALWGGRRTHNANDFFLASRRMGTWLVAFSHTANATPAWLLLTFAGAAFAWGLSAAWIWLAVVGGYLLNGLYVAPRLRQMSVSQGSMSLTQVLGADGGDRLQPLIVRSAILILSMTMLLEVGAVLHLTSGVFETSFGFDATSSRITAIAAIVVFALIGGYWALSFSDIVQVGVMMLIALLVPLVALAVTDGLEQMRIGFDALGSGMSHWFGERRGVVALAFVLGTCGLGYDIVGQPHAVNRFMAARDEATLRDARWISLGLVSVLLALTLLAGWSASVLYGGLARPELVFFAVVERALPPAVSAAIVALVLGVVLMGMGNRLLVLASCLSADMRRAVSPLSFAWARVVLVFYAILAVCLSLYGGETLLNRALFAFTAIGASFGPLLLVRLAGKRIRPGSTLGAMWAGFVLTLLFHVLPDAPGDFLERVFPFVASLGIALTGGERRRNPDRADRAQETVHDRVPI